MENEPNPEQQQDTSMTIPSNDVKQKDSANITNEKDFTEDKPNFNLNCQDLLKAPIQNIFQPGSATDELKI